MARRDVVVVGASAGGVEALRGFVSGLPADLPAAVLVVLHMPTGGRSALAAVLERPSTLPVRAAIEAAPLVPGTVTVAVPDRHLLLTGDDRLTLSLGPRENGHRPSVDVLFRSAAQAAGLRVIGVVLSGALDDGASGMAAVVSRGGVAVVQDPADALYDSMPRRARDAVGAAHVLPAAEIGALLDHLTREDLADLQAAPAPLDMRLENLVGHAWSAESLAAQHTSAVEAALWMALRALEEKAELSRAMAGRAGAAGHELTARTFSERADDAHQAAVLIRDLLESVARETPVGAEDGAA